MPAVIQPARTLRRLWFVLPFAFCALALLLANSGVRLEPTAKAATTDNVTVTALVDSTITISDGCGGAMNLTVLLGGYTDAQCQITFGSTIDNTVTLRGQGSTATFLSGGVFADETTNTTTCVALSAVDEVGLKVNAKSANVTNSLCTADSTAGGNTNHRTIPDAYLPICASNTTAVLTHTCTIGVGVFEFGSNAANGSYGGTLNLDVLN